MFITWVRECIKQSIRWKPYIRGAERAESHEKLVGFQKNFIIWTRYDFNP